MTDPHLSPGGYVPHAPYGSYRDSVAVDAPRRARWYRPGRSVAGAATFTAVWAWLAIPATMLARAAQRAFDGYSWLFGPQTLPMLLACLAYAFVLRGAVATARPAAAWYRAPVPSVRGGLALAHAVVACAAMAISLVRPA